MKRLLLPFLMIICIGKLAAQTSSGIVQGKVLTADGHAAPGLLVYVKGSKNIAYSQNNGEFKLIAPQGKQLLIIHAVLSSYEQEIVVGNETLQLPNVNLKEKEQQLKEVVVTAQYGAQSLKNNIFQVRTISAERIRLRSATSIPQLLATEIGFRFSNDLVLGTTDFELMGMSGRNIKILLDGVPMIDRSDSRESLSQIDINTIERVEIVEGPLSVVYGTDALAGVINIITKTANQSLFSLNLRVQDETAGNEYDALSGNGLHHRNLNASWQKKGFSIMGGFTQNDFGGWNLPSKTASIPEVATTRSWLPKAQLLSNTKVGFANQHINLWYRLDGLNEKIDSRGGMNTNNYIAKFQTYTTNRFTHQFQSAWQVSPQFQLNAIAGFTTLKRSTRTVLHNFTNDEEVLSNGIGEQDIARFNTGIFRATAQYKFSSAIAIQPGIEYNRDAASANRIAGDPVISDYAFFVSSEMKPWKNVLVRPGLRFIKNSKYDAPPVIPSLNVKFGLTNKLDFRVAYARGFRSPALRELYYNFVDASHTIYGNPNLKAEESNSFTAGFAWNSTSSNELHYQANLSGFYNVFNNRIEFGQSPDDVTVTTLINVSKFKTAGGSFDQTLRFKNWNVNVVLAYVGRFNDLFDQGLPIDVPELKFTTELSSNLSYTFPKINTTASFFYRYVGDRPNYQYNSTTQVATLTKIEAFSWADLMFNKVIYRHLTINAGIKNLFNITDLNNTSTATGGAHSTGGGSVPYSYGRSYALGLTFNWNKN